MNFAFTKAQLAQERKTIDFAEKEISPYISRLETDLVFREELFRKMAKSNLFLLTVSEKDGGHFIDSISYVLALKAVAKVDAGIGVAMSVINMVAEAISIYGTAAQKKKYIPEIAKGKCIPLAFALTEPNAGSDAKSILTYAKADLNGYLIEGEKKFITNGDLAKLLIVFAKTDKKKGAEGITAFIVERPNKGLEVIKKENKLGLLTANLVGLKLSKCLVPKENVLGKIGEGFKIALASLDSGRISIAAQALGIAEGAYEAALSFSQERHQFGHPISENQTIAFRLADMKVKLDCGRLLLLKAAWQRDQGASYTLEASEAKLFCSEIANEIASDALQIHGGYGYVKDYPAEKYFRDARVTTLYEGTSEIQRLIISRKILSVG
jgi:acyl-CoA dehydrogenase